MKKLPLLMSLFAKGVYSEYQNNSNWRDSD